MSLRPPGKPFLTEGQTAVRNNASLPQPAPAPTSSSAGGGLEVYRKPQYTQAPGLDYSQVSSTAFKAEREASIRANEQRRDQDFQLGRDYAERQEQEQRQAQKEREAQAAQAQKDAEARQKLDRDTYNFEFKKLGVQLGRQVGENPATGQAEFLDSDDDWQAKRATERQKRIDAGLADLENKRKKATQEKWTAEHGIAENQRKRAETKRAELEAEASRSDSYEARKPFDEILADMAKKQRGSALAGSLAGVEAVAKKRHPEKAGWLGMGDENAEARAKALTALQGEDAEFTPEEEAQIRAANPEGWKAYDAAKGKADTWRNASAAEKQWREKVDQLKLAQDTNTFALEDAEVANMRARRDNGELANERKDLDARMATAKARYDNGLAAKEAAYQRKLSQGLTSDQLAEEQLKHRLGLLEFQRNYLDATRQLEAEDEALTVKLLDFNRLLERADRRQKGQPVGESPALPLGPGAQNEDWQAFPEESQTLGIPREEMPQVRAEHRGALAQYLRGQNVRWRDEMVLPSELKPSQAEYSLEKVAKAKEHTGGNRAIIVSRDGYVIDGHHQWMAALEGKPDEKVSIYRLDKPAAEALEIVMGFPSATTSKESAPLAAAQQPEDRSDRASFEASPERQAMKQRIDAISEEMRDPATSPERQKALGDEQRELSDRYWQDDPAGEVEAIIDEYRAESAPKAKAIQEEIVRQMAEEDLSPEDAVQKESELLAQMGAGQVNERLTEVLTRSHQRAIRGEISPEQFTRVLRAVGIDKTGPEVLLEGKAREEKAQAALDDSAKLAAKVYQDTLNPSFWKVEPRKKGSDSQWDETAAGLPTVSNLERYHRAYDALPNEKKTALRRSVGDVSDAELFAQFHKENSVGRPVPPARKGMGPTPFSADFEAASKQWEDGMKTRFESLTPEAKAKLREAVLDEKARGEFTLLEAKHDNHANPQAEAFAKFVAARIIQDGGMFKAIAPMAWNREPWLRCQGASDPPWIKQPQLTKTSGTASNLARASSTKISEQWICRRWSASRTRR